MIIRDIVKVKIVRNLDEYPYMHKHLMNPSWKQICDAQRDRDADTIVTISGNIMDFSKVKSRNLSVYYVNNSDLSNHIELYNAVVSIRKAMYGELLSRLTF